MKRQHESGDEEVSDDEPESTKPRLEEADVLRNIHHHMTNDDEDPVFDQDIEKRLYHSQQQYYTKYMEKLMKQVPMGETIVEIVETLDIGDDNKYMYMYTGAKNIVNSNGRLRNVKSIHKIFDMVSQSFWKAIHNKVVAPSLSTMIPTHKLNEAFNMYLEQAQVVESEKEFELECLLYCIQEDMEKKKPSKIPNPLYSRFTQQLKAMSDYVIVLLGAIAKVDAKKDPGNVVEQEPLDWELNTSKAIEK